MKILCMGWKERMLLPFKVKMMIFMVTTGQTNVYLKVPVMVAMLMRYKSSSPLNTIELQRRVVRVGQQSTPSSSQSGLVIPKSDTIYADICQKLSAGCSCNDNCLSEFTASEVCFIMK